MDFTETERAMDASASLVARESDPSRVDDLQKNSFYNSKENLIIAVGLWNMKRGTKTKVIRSDLGCVYFTCKHSDKCKFDLHASSHGGGMWGVHKLKEHSCQADLRRAKKIKTHSKVVAAYVANRIRDDGEVIKPKSIMAELVRDFGIKIKYDVALRARNLEMEMIYGRVDDSFLLLPRYLYALREANPGTLIGLEVDVDCRFKHLFVALAASISPFYFHLRPVIVVDGTHLKGKNSGILFVAVAKDGNEAVFPLAIGVGPIENDESWKWFMSHLRQACGEPENLLVVSDAHVSIANAVKSEFPNATYGICYYHLLNKIKGYGPGVAELFYQAAYAYKQSDYTRVMSTWLL
ncbi:protein FAR-RED ELONGATED HYPOCOTYL 3-like [Salvia miltiorrhiza]|uniref:protein FAR-RED ELONGATED HYPOCOTYL 3-like n=1 Tax=Salvia miltiorrhiza TaxID=226208 RepID=UPI0025AD4BFF|nr:protein FAR-RED ELONGATED HYPOCOTYL 3-like [Salvia miltiorrhiza]